MPKHNPATTIIRWIAPDAVWDGIKWIGGSSMLSSIGHLLMLEIHRSPVDWYWIAALFGGGATLSGYATYRERNRIPHAVAVKELSTSTVHESATDRLLSPFQVELLQLSHDLQDFLRGLGAEPAPKYTAEEINEMPLSKSEALIRSQDGDYAEACEYWSRDGTWFFSRTWQNAQGLEREIMARWRRLLPWYEKVASSYALECKDRVDKMRHRLVIQGLHDEALLLPVEGRDGAKNIHTIAFKLWELAFKAGENDGSKT